MQKTERKNLIKKIAWLVATLTLILSETAKPVRADLFGGDVAVLTQILAENIRRYYQLQTIISQAREQKDFLRLLNSGIDNLSGLMAVFPIRDQKILEDLRTFQEATKKIQSLYGPVPMSAEFAIQTLHDQTVAESIKLTNDSKNYAEQQEVNAVRIISESQRASPKGAARMNAQTSAEILHTLNQLLKINGQMLKLQSEGLAQKNKESKDSVRHFQRVRADVNHSSKTYQANMGFPKF